MPSGGSIMIAGLLQNDIASAASGFPGLMDVPVLGQLFRSNSFQHNESELVVIVSAYIVQPTASNQLMTGADGFAPSSDLSRFLWNRLQDVYVQSRALPAVPAELQGPFGYAVQ
jgi:pilus assembly protein CpaC